MATPEQQAELDKITAKPSYKEVRWMAADLVRQFPDVTLCVTDYGHHVSVRADRQPFLLACTNHDGDDVLTTLSQYGRLVTALAAMRPTTSGE